MERGTPGETATPQVVYTPPADARRPRSRAGARRTRGGKVVETKNTRFERDFVPPPKALTLEERIIDSLPNASSGSLSSSTTLRPVRLVEGSTIKEFAEKLGIKPKDIVALLMQRGMFPTINQPLTDEVAADLGKRFGYEVAFVPFEAMVAEEEFEDLIAADADDVEVERAPVVTVMGHVDHGKTSLLDSIRTTDVAAGEAGGITQHIGAYSVHVPDPDDPGKMRRIVFLDTPGHEAFTMMRARGAKATDIVVLVVAADDGVMPQTVEAIEHARAANVPIVVAINKIDRPDANPDRVKQQLANLGLQPVDWGGDTEMVSVSAKQRENIDNLLETVLLTADILNLRASPTRLAAGVVLEAKLDRGRGAVATVLVQQERCTSAIRSSSVRYSAKSARCSMIGARRSPKPGRRRQSRCWDYKACRKPVRLSKLSPMSRARSRSLISVKWYRARIRWCKLRSAASRRLVKQRSKNFSSCSRPTCKARWRY